MWPDGNGPQLLGRGSSSSEVVVIDDRGATAAVEYPAPSEVNVVRSSRVHIGPKFVSVNQTIQNSEVVKELPFHSYLWEVVKNTTRAERISCGIAVFLVALCIFLIVYFTVIAKEIENPNNIAPHEWNITRDMWLAEYYSNPDLPEENVPVRLVVVHHTVGAECHTFTSCAAEIRNLQGYFFREYNYDIPYNFFIGNDGRVYEGRGWGKEGAHTQFYNRCSVGIGFMGDYREEKEPHSTVTAQQLNRTKLLLEDGVRRGYLDPKYLIVGGKDLKPTASPGSSLYNQLRRMAHYDTNNRFKQLNCTQVTNLPL